MITAHPLRYSYNPLGYSHTPWSPGGFNYPIRGGSNYSIKLFWGSHEVFLERPLYLECVGSALYIIDVP
jgi:hypothetical protein